MTDFPIKNIEIEVGKLDELVRMLKKIYKGKISVSPEVEEEDFKGLILYCRGAYPKRTIKEIRPTLVEVYDIFECK